MHQAKKNPEGGPSSIPSVQSPQQSQFTHEDESQNDSSHPSLDSSK